MGRIRSNSSPELIPPPYELKQQVGSPLEGVSNNVKLLLKLIEDHHDATKEETEHNPQRVAGMIAILDDVRSRIERSQLPKKPKIQRCSSELRRGGGAPPRDRKPHESIAEENHKLRQELSASITAQKSLGMMFSSLGKEKEIMAAELARRVQELKDMEELVGDLRAQNDKLTEKVKACTTNHDDEEKGGRDSQGNAALSEEEEEILRSLDGFRPMKRKVRRNVEEDKEGGMCKETDQGAKGGEVFIFFERVLGGFQAKFSKDSPKTAM